MNLMEIKEQIRALNEKVDFYHVDIMDGHYVRNITLSPFFIEQIKPYTHVPIEAHIMVENPADFIEMIAKAGADYITPHAETINKDAFRVINQIKSFGCKVGIALNPATPLEYINHYIHLIDKITIMTVDPGYAGQKFIVEMTDKIRQAKELKEKHGFNYIIEVDGSCNERTFKTLAEAGTESFVVGSSGLFNLDPDICKAWSKMEQNFLQEVGSLN